MRFILTNARYRGQPKVITCPDGSTVIFDLNENGWFEAEADGNVAVQLEQMGIAKNPELGFNIAIARNSLVTLGTLINFVTNEAFLRNLLGYVHRSKRELVQARLDRVAFGNDVDRLTKKVQLLEKENELLRKNQTDKEPKKTRAKSQ